FRQANGNSMATDASGNPVVGAVPVKTFLCPSNPVSIEGNGTPGAAMRGGDVQRDGYASCDYAANAQGFHPQLMLTITQQVPDGSSNTVAFAERLRNCSPTGSTVTTQPAWAWNTIVANGTATPLYDPYASPTFGADPSKPVGSTTLGQMS